MLAAALLVQVAVTAPSQTLIGITNQNWQYFATTGGDPGVGWQNVGFNDTSWLTGRGLFGQDTGYPWAFVSTFAGPSTGGPNVSFYRTHFNWSGSTAGVILTLTNAVDDGSVIYMNGTELLRFNMPDKATTPVPDQTTFASGSLTEPIVRVFQLALSALTNGNPNPLVVGDNTMAVSVHNNAASSSDTVFGLSANASQAVAPCTDNLQPTNRTVTAGQNTTFTVVQGPGCGIPAPTLQWYRNIGFGDEAIAGQTGTSLTVTNAQTTEAGQYFVRLINSSSPGGVDSRRAVLTVISDIVPPVFLRLRVDADPTIFRLLVNEPLCVDAGACGSDATFQFNWQIVNINNPGDDLGVATVTVTGNDVLFISSVARTPGERYKLVVDAGGSGISDHFGNFVASGLSITNEPEATAISVGVTGSKTYNFAEAPDAREFSTFNWTGGANSVTDTPALIDGKVAAFDIATIATALAGATGTPPNAGASAVWAQDGGYLQTRPTGVEGEVILARIRNDSGATKAAITVSYDETVESPVVEEALGHLVYYSQTGLPNSWLPVVAVDGSTTGAKSFDLTLTGWTAGSFVYVLFVDDNGSGSPDTSVEIDNFRVTFPSLVNPVNITSSPTSVSTNEGATVEFTVVAAGSPPLSFQWLKGGSPIANGGNISGATTAQLTIAGALSTDAGSYSCRVSNPVPSTQTSAAATLTISPDLTRPVLANAVNTSDTTVTLTFSKAMGTTATVTGNYVFSPAVAVSSAVLSTDGRTVTLTTAARPFPAKHRLTMTGLRDNRGTPNLLNPNPTVVDLTASTVIGAYGDTWKYNTNNLDGQTWTLPAYNDSAWLVGGGFFGFEPTAAITNALPAPRIVTALNPNSDTANTNAFVTTYFRRQVTLPALGAGTTYLVSSWVDDGAVFYLDGAEIGRYQMAAGVPTFVTRSPGGNGEAVLSTFTFTATAGVHTLAVEVHQAGVTTSDVVFGCNISAVSLPSALTITRGTAGTNVVSWTADGSYELVGSQNVQGNYNLVAGNPFGFFNIAPTPAATTNHFFYHLRHRGQ